MSDITPLPKKPTAEILPPVPFLYPDQRPDTPLDSCIYTPLDAKRPNYDGSDWKKYVKTGSTENESLITLLRSVSQFSLADKVSLCRRDFISTPRGNALFRCQCRLLCFFCQRTWAKKYRVKYRDAVLAMSKPHEIIVTYKNLDYLTGEGINRFRDDRRALLRLDRFKQSCSGGIARLEFTHSPLAGWHPHWNMLVDLHKPISKTWLKGEWTRISRAQQVYIKDLSSRSPEYLLGRLDYITKAIPADKAPRTPSAVKQFLTALYDQQTFIAFGNCRKSPSRASDASAPGGGSRPVDNKSLASEDKDAGEGWKR